jgi:osmotically-inducible protein OsmY
MAIRRVLLRQLLISLAQERLRAAKCAPPLPGNHDQAQVLTELSRALNASGYASLRAVQGQFEEGVLTLVGTVKSHHQKQVAQSAALKIEAVRDVRNLIDVRA